MENRNTYAQIDLNILQHNAHLLFQENNKPLFCVVKANGYGHGASKVASFLEYLDYVAYFCVSSFDEAMELRNNNIKKPIINLGYTSTSDLQECIENDITVSIISKEWLIEANSRNSELSNLRCHIKIDTGMNRLGIKSTSEYLEVLELSKILNLNVEGIFTHYHSSDANDNSTQKQLEIFKQFLKATNQDYTWIHIANSDAAFAAKETSSNAVRCGLALFGYSSYPTQLKPVLSMYAQISQIKTIEKGETVSYSATFTAPQKMKVAIVPIGYADGLNRKFTNNFFYINNQPTQILGKICMDQTIIHYPDHEDLKKVEIIGPNQSASDIAKRLDTIPYEILTTISDRITRVYMLDGKVIDSINYRFR